MYVLKLRKINERLRRDESRDVGRAEADRNCAREVATKIFSDKDPSKTEFSKQGPGQTRRSPPSTELAATRRRSS
jgi:hypothetical protein